LADGPERKELHKDHRSRLKARFLNGGLDGFEDHQVLELLLFYAILGQDKLQKLKELFPEVFVEKMRKGHSCLNRQGACCKRC
jgi:DNA repair protein RadC